MPLKTQCKYLLVKDREIVENLYKKIAQPKKDYKIFCDLNYFKITKNMKAAINHL